MQTKKPRRHRDDKAKAESADPTDSEKRNNDDKLPPFSFLISHFCFSAAFPLPEEVVR